jgi:hypothetical protein
VSLVRGVPAAIAVASLQPRSGPLRVVVGQAGIRVRGRNDNVEVQVLPDVPLSHRDPQTKQDRRHQHSTARHWPTSPCSTWLSCSCPRGSGTFRRGLTAVLAPDAGQPRSARFAGRGPRPRCSQPTRTPRQPRAPGPAAPARTNGCGNLPRRTGRVRQPLTSPAPGHETRGAPCRIAPRMRRRHGSGRAADHLHRRRRGQDRQVLFDLRERPIGGHRLTVASGDPLGHRRVGEPFGHDQLVGVGQCVTQRVVPPSEIVSYGGGQLLHRRILPRRHRPLPVTPDACMPGAPPRTPGRKASAKSRP